MALNIKNLGIVLIAFSIILLVILTYIKIDNDAKGVLWCEKFEQFDLDMKNCPAHQSNFSWVIIVAYGLIFLMLAIGIYMVVFIKPSQTTMLKEASEPVAELKKDFKPVDMSRLDEEETRLYELIKSKGGSTYQGDLIRETGFSKVKTTRILDRLELKGILERKRRGMTNIIILK